MSAEPQLSVIAFFALESGQSGLIGKDRLEIFGGQIAVHALAEIPAIECDAAAKLL
jgi:hypothetical protein